VGSCAKLKCKIKGLLSDTWEPENIPEIVRSLRYVFRLPRITQTLSVNIALLQWLWEVLPTYLIWHAIDQPFIYALAYALKGGVHWLDKPITAFLNRSFSPAVGCLGSGASNSTCFEDKLGPMNKPRAALWRWHNNGSIWTLLGTPFTCDFQLIVSWAKDMSLLSVSHYFKRNLFNRWPITLETPANKLNFDCMQIPKLYHGQHKWPLGGAIYSIQATCLRPLSCLLAVL